MADKEKNLENSVIQVNVGNDEQGIIQVSNNVIANIIMKYVQEIEGVVRFAPQSLVEGLTSMFSRRGYESNINIDMTEEGALITLALVFRFGVNVPAVAKEIQTILFDKIPALAGYKVVKVNVNVVELEEEEPVEQAPVEMIQQ